MGRPLNIGVLTPNEEGAYYGGLINAIAKRAKTVNTRVFVIQTTWNNDISIKSEYDDIIAWKQMDGWIILPNAICPEYLSKICSVEKPVVLISDDLGNPATKVVLPDNYSGMKQAVQHLIQHGHKKIAFVGCLLLNDQKQRKDGYLDALAEAGLYGSDDDIYGTLDAMVIGGEDAAKRIIASKIPYTAIAAACDYNAIGVIDALLREDYKVPGDIAVVGFDNMDNGRLNKPPLTTINIVLHNLSYQAVDIIIQEIKKTGSAERTTFVPAELVIRSSCGCKTNEDNICEDTVSIETYKKTINKMGQVLFDSFNISSELMQGGIEHIKSMSWMPKSVLWACLAMFEKNAKDNTLWIKEHVIFNRRPSHLRKDNTEETQALSVPSTTIPVEKACPIDEFPPIELIPEIKNDESANLIWLQPIRYNQKICGIIAIMSPFNEGLLLFNLDSWQRILDQFSLALKVDDLTENLEKQLNALKKARKSLEKANRELKAISHTDALTGIANRRYFDEMILRELRSAYRKKEPIGLIMLDIDHFKNYNDAYGHIQGDECLISVAKAIKKSVQRPLDFVARFGGEEFVILLPNTDREGVIILAEKVRLAVEAMRIKHEYSSAAPVVTISLGIFNKIPTESDTPVNIIDSTDRALYKAKEAGRNRVAG